MVPKSGTQRSRLNVWPSDAEFAELIGRALQLELGGSRRATKTVMSWTGVSDHTARAWLSGKTSPSALHLIILATNSDSVMTSLLRLAGRERTSLQLELESIEVRLIAVLANIRDILSQ